MIVEVLGKFCKAVFKRLLVRDVKGVKRMLLGRWWVRWLIAVGLLRLELLALGAVDREASWHWRSDFNWNLLLNKWLLWWGLERLECTKALLNLLNTLAKLERLLLLGKTIRLEVKRGRVELWNLLGKIILRYEGNNIFCHRLDSKLVYW